MRSSTQTACGFIPALVVAFALPAFAGAPVSCVKAVSSKHGTFLVITDAELKPEGGNVFEVERVSLGVFPREEFINAKDRVTSTGTFWKDGPQWSVVFDSTNSHPVPGCPLSLITDDGEFLIVLNVYVFDSALRIYRRRDHLGDPRREGPDHGVFIRDIPLREIWPASKFSGLQIITDGSPQWFAGGTFEFSNDCRTLIHKTRWGNIVRINLQDGSVSKS